MSWLLDVNTLVALAHQGHSGHSKAIQWFASLIGSDARLSTCALTEIGFVRVSIQAGFENNAPDAVETLRGLKESSPVPFDFVSDSLGADRLPAYVVGPGQVTDGHLLELARECTLQLATLNKNIPGAYLIS